MIRSYLKLAFRHITRQLNYSLINIGGLAIGIACCFVIMLYAMQELGYEKKFTNHKRVYRIATHFMTMGDFANGPRQAGAALSEGYPWVEEVAFVNVMGQPPLYNGEKETKGIGISVTNNFFKLFDYPFIAGNPEQSLANLNSIIISQEISNTLFGDEDPMGKIVEVGPDKKVYSVTGIIDLKGIKSHINVDFWTSADPPRQNELDGPWTSASKNIYVMTNGNVSQLEIQEAVDDLIQKNVYASMQTSLSFDEWIVRDDAFRLIVQPVDDIYLKGILNFDISTGGNETTVYVLIAIAILILTIASVNFINLTTARADKRAKEIGIRKVIGGVRVSLVGQFLLESVLVSMIAVILSLGLAELILMTFQSFTGITLFNSVFDDPFNAFIAMGIGLVLGVLSGVYPAIYLSAFKPIEAIKKGTFSARSNQLFRNILVIVQFTLSITLITSTLIIFGQIKFMSEKDLGFNRQDVLILDNAYVLGNNFNDLKLKLESYNGVQSVSQVNMLPGTDNSFSMSSFRVSDEDERVRANWFRADKEFINALELELLEGRNFDPELASDSSAVILNEEAVKALGLENPVGTILNNFQTVIGVVKDFNFESLRSNIGPAALSYEPGYGQKMAVRIEKGKYQDVINFINEQWNNNLQNDPLTYFFLDDNFQRLMKKDQELGRIVSMFTGLAILISCLGLFGLSSYTIALKRKEIGIRKVMGASVTNILVLLNWKFSRLVLLALIISTPLAFLGMEEWLSGFAYRINIASTYFVYSFVVTVLIAWVTVSYQSMKAALSNPVNSLREE